MQKYCDKHLYTNIMHSLDTCIEGFVKLGRFLSQFSAEGIRKKDPIPHNDDFFEIVKHNIILAGQHNGWFTEANILHALTQWSEVLTRENLTKWMGNYPLKSVPPKKVALIMAGNIPLVGFHDLLCVLLTGHNALVKRASGDMYLLPVLAQYLMQSDPQLEGKIEFSGEKLGYFDAVIATGSNNTARYFEYYFRKKPNLIRKSRNSAAILTGNETPAQLTALGKDIFTYYGLGCRNISKLFVPETYDFKSLFEAIYPYHSIIDHKKYANNYDYNKAVYLMSRFTIFDNGFLMLKEDEAYASPIATVFYERYKSPEAVRTKTESDTGKIQCIVADGFSADEVPFGQTQQPALWDYADRIDTVDFLLKI